MSSEVVCEEKGERSPARQVAVHKPKGARACRNRIPIPLGFERKTERRWTVYYHQYPFEALRANTYKYAIHFWRQQF